jgi:hypothetical protein
LQFKKRARERGALGVPPLSDESLTLIEMKERQQSPLDRNY